jgi:hypothetical protein
MLSSVTFHKKVALDQAQVHLESSGMSVVKLMPRMILTLLLAMLVWLAVAAMVTSQLFPALFPLTLLLRWLLSRLMLQLQRSQCQLLIGVSQVPGAQTSTAPQAVWQMCLRQAAPSH